MKPSPKKTLWLLLGSLGDTRIPLLLPSLAWIAEKQDALLECYLESQRDGRLFAKTGSTVLGGSHHQQFNYLAAAFDLRILKLGSTSVFDSSIHAFGLSALAQGDSLNAFFADLFRNIPAPSASQLLLIGSELPQDWAPYFFPEILYREAIAFPVQELNTIDRAAPSLSQSPRSACFLTDAEAAKLTSSINRDDSFPLSSLAEFSRHVSEKWKSQARGVVFGDPPAVLSQLASHCRHRRMAVFADKQPIRPIDMKVSHYTEEISSLATAAASLASELGNPVIVGRQTGDGDIFEWSKQGVAIQIIDPNRPAFPVVEMVKQPWIQDGSSPFDHEPTDDELRSYLKEGKVLASLIWHSGEVAHNEAMVNLMDLAAVSGIKMGMGVHAARYETCPQLWELLAIDRRRGGVRGLIEPILHSGGLGVMAECNCPPSLLAQHCAKSLERIREVAGEQYSPRGYYAFMDSDLDTLSRVPQDLYETVAGCGLDYFVSSALPGRNRALWCSDQLIALNQTSRSICPTSPFVRITTVEDLRSYVSSSRPGWILGTLDSPVIAFNPYIWKHGSRFMDIVAFLTETKVVNVLPHTVARYARLMMEEGHLAEPSATPLPATADSAS